MPGQQAPSITDTARSSCKRVAEAHSNHVRVDQEAIAAFAASLDPATVVAVGSHGFNLPLKFDDQTTEVNLMALYHLLHFGSGYDPALLSKCKRDAQETVQFGVIGMYMSAKRLDAPWMAAFNAYNVHNFFGIESHEDQAVPNLPGVTMSRPGALAPLCSSLAEAVSSTGAALQDEGSASLGAAICQWAANLKQTNNPRPAAALVAELVDALPAFEDSALYDGAKVVFACKAQALVAELHARFSKEDPRFDLSDVAQLTGDSGPTTAAVLRHKGVLVYCEDLASTVDAGQELPPGPHERGIRAATVTALDAVVAAAGGAFTAQQLSTYLQHLADEGQELHGKIKKHVTPGTKAY